MVYIIYCALFFPLAGFLGLTATSFFIRKKLAGIIACSTVFISFACFVSLLGIFEDIRVISEDVTLYRWLPVDRINADFTLHLDPLSFVMALVITGVGFLIHVYSIGYMDHEDDFARYFACLNFFIFSMLLLVLAENLLLLFVGWEGVGLASYLLIGFWYQKPAAAKAATKAFVINRIGDFGLLLGLLLTFHTFGTGSIEEVSRLTEGGFLKSTSVLNILALLYFVGAIGKSAQLPLHTWLPDAMEGPTPVSALIHAATMVTAGVYLVVRMHSLFILAPDVLQAVGVIGGVTSLFAALCAVGQVDLKRVLAYSTVSQLGLMFLACGVGAFYAAMFHLVTHAFIKALLFLSAGNVVHMMHGTTDMQSMGGLRKIFRQTHWLFLIGVLALSGIPPLSAFFSKDLILEQEYLAGFKTLFFIGLIASILTGFYLTRAYCLTFTGACRFDKEILSTVKEAPGVMLFPVYTLALLSIVGGLLGIAIGKTSLLEDFLGEVGIALPVREFLGNILLAPETLLAIGGSVLGVGTAAFIYTRQPDKISRPIALLRNAFYIDQIYRGLVIFPLKKASAMVADFFEPRVFTGLICSIANGIQDIAQRFQRLQNGQIRSYLAGMVFGTVLVLVYFVF